MQWTVVVMQIPICEMKSSKKRACIWGKREWEGSLDSIFAVKLNCMGHLKGCRCNVGSHNEVVAEVK